VDRSELRMRIELPGARRKQVRLHPPPLWPLRRGRRRTAWVIGALCGAIAAELVVLVAGAHKPPPGLLGSRLGPLDAPAEFSSRTVRLPGDPLPVLLRQVRELPSGVIERVPDVVDWHERLPWGLPVSLERGWVSSEFSMSRIHPVTGERRPHYGIDLAVDAGTPIHVTARGVVTFAGLKGGYGLLVIVDHENGFSTRYAHCSKLLVKPGNQVERGRTIALSGATGNVTGEHLHYEVRVNGEAVNPRRYLPTGLPTERPPGM
jgi:murein DD-endopeptidase MepM/ murein hydrolase activator NlpD